MPTLTRFTLLAATLATAATAPLSARQADAATERRVDAVFAHFDRSDSPGAAVVVVRDGEVLLRKGYGMANLEHAIPITPTTVFDIASVSKQFAGFSIALLVEPGRGRGQGRIRLDDDIRKHLPELPEFGPTITIDHLIHHTSGIRDWPGTLAVAGWRMDDVISFEQILTMARNQRDLNFTPGAEYSYSNTGYNILAELVSRVSGQSFREWTDANIFRPLGMTNTHFHDNHLEIVENRARGYGRSGDGYVSVPNGLTALGSSSLYTTVDDLAKWVMNFDDGRVGGMAVIQRMQQRGVLNDGEQISYAFGQSIGNYRGLETWSHGGSWAGFRTTLFRVPEQRFGVVILTNAGGFNPTRAAQNIIDIYLEDELAPRTADASAEPGSDLDVTVEGHILNEYAGTYRLGPAWLVTITRDGASLMTQATAEDRQPMRAVSEREFFVPAYGASITFQRNDAGVVNHIEYRGINAPRVKLRSHTVAELRVYDGEYYSEELAATYQLSVRDGKLIARHRRHSPITLASLLQDEFRGDQWFFQAVEFDRDANGGVVGFRVSNGRSRNLKFARR